MMPSNTNDTTAMDDNQLQLAAVGDLLLCGRYNEYAKAGDADQVFEPLLAVLRDADIVVANMECPLTFTGAPRSDKLCLRGDPAYAPAMRKAGIHVVSLANNHAFDFGPVGYAETRRVLEEAGIAAVGAGMNLEQATRPTVVEQNGLRLAFLAYCDESTSPSDQADDQAPGTAPLILERVIQDIKRWRSEVDHVIVLFHWGIEYSPYPTPDQVTLAHTVVDAGAAAIIGHHSHMLQGIETYQDRVIAYSLGNLTDTDVDWQGPTRRFTSTITTIDRETMVLRLTVTRNKVRLHDFVPLWLNEAGQPIPAPADIATKMRSDVTARSQGLRVDELKVYWEKMLVNKRVMGPLLRWWQSGTPWDKILGFRPSQLKTLYLLIETFARIRLSRSSSRWTLFNPRNDKRPMPCADVNRAGNDE